MFLRYLDFKLLCQQLQLGTLLFAPRLLSGGSLNQNFYIQTDRGRFLLKQGHPLRRVENQLWQYRSWIEGEVLSPHQITFSQMGALGRLLADQHVHAVTSNLFLAQPSFIVLQWQRYLQLLARHGFPDLTLLYQHDPWVLNTLEQVQIHWRDIQLQNCVCHRDIFPSNVIWQAVDMPILIDWEWQGPLPLLAELIGVVVNWCVLNKQFDTERANFLLDAYYRSMPMTNQKECQLAYLSLSYFWLQWVEFNIQRYLYQSHFLLDEAKIAAKEIISTLATLNWLNRSNFLLEFKRIL